MALKGVIRLLPGITESPTVSGFILLCLYQKWKCNHFKLHFNFTMLDYEKENICIPNINNLLSIRSENRAIDYKNISIFRSTIFLQNNLRILIKIINRVCCLWEQCALVKMVHRLIWFVTFALGVLFICMLPLYGVMFGAAHLCT